MPGREPVTGAGQGCGGGGRTGRANRGPQGTCACATCGHRVPHQAGVPCREVQCPKCGGAMTRRD